MKNFLRIFLGGLFLFFPAVAMAKEMPYNDWQRYQAASAVILGQVLPGEGKKKIKVLQYYKGSGLDEPFEVNLLFDTQSGGSPVELYSGYQLVAYLGKKSKEGSYDLAVGSDFIYIKDKDDSAALIADLISRVDQSKSDLAKFKIIEDVLTSESKIVPFLPVLFLKGNMGNMAPQVLSTWLPVETNVMPKSLSRAAGDYLTQHLDEVAKNDSALFEWLVFCIIQNYDNDKEKFLSDIIRTKPLAISRVVVSALTKTILRDRKKQKEALFAVAVQRIDEALNAIKPADQPSNSRDELGAQQFLAAVSSLSFELNPGDEKMTNVVKTWAKNSSWNEFALSALASVDPQSVDFINVHANNARDPGLIAALASIGNEATLNLFLQRVSRGSPQGANDENRSFKELGPALMELSRRLGGSSQQRILRAYLTFLARWQTAYPSGWTLSVATNQACRTEDILATVNNLLTELTGEKFTKPEEWLSFGARKFKISDASALSQQLLQEAGPVLKIETGPYATINCNNEGLK